MFVTMVEGVVEPDREDALLSAWAEVAAGPIPGGFIESSLVRSDDRRWRILTVWESKEAVMAMRQQGPPAGPAMFGRAGSEASVSMWSVEGRITAS
jgi:heme-degrading monooxygenase HmoA